MSRNKNILKSKPNISNGFASPFRYPGGKSRFTGLLSRIIDNNYNNSDRLTLIEPYAGGAGASLKLLLSGLVDRIIINDLDEAVYTFWKTAVSKPDFLIRKIRETEINIEEWRIQKEIFTNRASYSEEKLAFATLFLNRANRSGIIEGGPIGGKNQAGEWNVRSRFNKDTIIKRIERIEANKDKIKVLNLDGISLLRKLEKHKYNDNYFIFLDPPYQQMGSSLYLNHYKDHDHKKLARHLKESCLKWMMTYDDTQFITDIYEENVKYRFTVSHKAYKSRIGKEILIFAKNVNHPHLSSDSISVN